ncbi:threonine aldolase [Puccinia sorghi]|uniref:Threonine aldolase n=1 Tax=Puccinia sorghi TaxID=27349 RepID=A0A0L6VDD2_9BASI|nr:threonine aldolase [Puccinia sorghi]
MVLHQIRLSGARLIVHIQVSTEAVDELVGLVGRMKKASSGTSSASEEEDVLLSIRARPAGTRT